MVTNDEENQIAIDVENDINNKNKLNNMYGPRDTFLCMFIGALTFLLMFFTFQYFATINDGIAVNFKYLFCNSDSNDDPSGTTDDAGVSDAVNFNDSS